jgi:DNA-binding response OmpR family regulator
LDVDEAVARLEVAVRRQRRGREEPRGSGRPEPRTVDVGDLSIDVPRWHVEVAGRRIDLTPTEFKLLVHLANRTGEMVTREQLAQDVWGDGSMRHSRTIDAYVRRVRHKLGERATPRFLPVRGLGYQVTT